MLNGGRISLGWTSKSWSLPIESRCAACGYGTTLALTTIVCRPWGEIGGGTFSGLLHGT